MHSLPGSYPEKLDLTNCEKEPIHIIGTVQPPGAILVCDSRELKITRCSRNIEEKTGRDISTILNSSLNLLFSNEICTKVKEVSIGEKLVLPEYTFKDKNFVGIVHLSNEEYIIDLEPVGNYQDPTYFREQLNRILNGLQMASSVSQLSRKAVSLVRELFNYDRVMLYQFDEEWNGEVVAEEKQEELESWLGLHYPATDIPKPAREIFLKQGVRIISDVHHDPSPIVTSASFKSGLPVDLSRSEVRGVSPIHIEYLKNMKVGASLTAAIILEGRLWGLLACHHYSPKFINYYQRQSLELLTQIFSNKLAVQTTRVFLEKTGSSEVIKRKLVDQMMETGSLTEALLGPGANFIQLISCSGGAIFSEGEVWLTGKTPSAEEVKKLVQNFLVPRQEKLFHTKSLSSMYPEAAGYKEDASGLMAVKYGKENRELLMWFRQETMETVNWGGKPQKNEVLRDGINYLSPRKSFEKWSQQVSGISLPWKEYDIEAVTSLRESVMHAYVRKQKEEIDLLYKDLTLLNKELETFTYGISHDLRAPLRGIEGYAQILEEDYKERLDDYGRSVVKTILSSAETMENLIDDLLSLGRLGKNGMKIENLSMVKIAEEVLAAINIKSRYPSSVVNIDPGLPDAHGDRGLIFQLLSNLIDNALKYSAKEKQPEVEIGFRNNSAETTYFVKDNGIGFDPVHKDKVFTLFSRLLKEGYTGTGIGLATAKKVVEMHDGKIWAETSPGKGSVFYFTLGHG